MPDKTDRDKILLPINKLLEANDKLMEAIDDSRQYWPYVSKCWIDELSEPTKDLAEHRLKPRV